MNPCILQRRASTSSLYGNLTQFFHVNKEGSEDEQNTLKREADDHQLRKAKQDSDDFDHPEIQEWKTAMDSYGRMYYYNTLTGVSSWELPLSNTEPSFPVQKPARPFPPSIENQNANTEKPKLFRSFSSVDHISITKPKSSQPKTKSVKKYEARTILKRPRSNTTSTIFMSMGTMSSQNDHATMRCIGQLLHEYILESLANSITIDEKFRVFNTRGQRFEACDTPTATEITNFMKYVFTTAQMESEGIIMSLIYVDRLLKVLNGQLQLLPCNWMSILFCSMIMASKVWDDNSMWNGDFCKICTSFSVRRVNELEIAYLSAVQFRVRVAASTYAKYYFNLRSMCISRGICKPSKIPLSKEDVEGLLLLEATSEVEDSSTLISIQNRRRFRRRRFCTMSTEELLATSAAPGQHNHNQYTACIEQLIGMQARS